MYHDAGAYTRNLDYGNNQPAFAGVNFKVSELTGAMLYAQLPRLDPLLRRLRNRRTTLAKYLSRSGKLRISPHNDPSSAVGLSVIFKRREDAKAFATQRGVERLIDIRRHVYTNWVPVLTQRTFDDRMNPYRWAHRNITYSPDQCYSTLDILERTCHVSLGAEYPATLMRLRAKVLLKSVS
jgi:dTDP-4-amino-4,6-dideoxygalactose transaminase